MKRARARRKNIETGGRDWTKIDWTKTNTQLAQELGVVRGTVHSQRKRYAPESLILKNYHPDPPTKTLAPPPPPKTPTTKTITTTIHNTPQPPNTTITVQHHPPRHWSQQPTKPNIPRDPNQLHQITVKADTQILTLGMLHHTFTQHTTLTSVQLANALQLTWTRDLHAAFEAYVDLGVLTATHEHHPDPHGGHYERTYAWRITRTQPTHQHNPKDPNP